MEVHQHVHVMCSQLQLNLQNSLFLDPLAFTPLEPGLVIWTNFCEQKFHKTALFSKLCSPFSLSAILSILKSGKPWKDSKVYIETMVPFYKNSTLQKETTKHQNQRQFYDKTAQNTLDGTFVPVLNITPCIDIKYEWCRVIKIVRS